MSEDQLERRVTVAERIREARKLAGLSQKQVADILGLHRPSVSEIEAGNRRVTAVELAKLAEIFDVSVAWLLGGVPDDLHGDDPRIQLAARELSKLKPEDLDRLLRLLTKMRGGTDDG
jgi:transcriptional regulator with XRE-family HTH domain